MSQLERGTPLFGQARRDGTPQTPRIGRTGSLQAPGISSVPPSSAAADDLNKLAQSMGLLGGAVNALGNLNRQIKGDEAAAEAKADIAIKAGWTTYAKENQAEIHEAWQQGILDGSIDLSADPSATARDFLADYAEANVPDMFDTEGAFSAFNSNLIPGMATTMVNHRQGIAEDAKKQQLDSYADGLAGRTEGFDDTIQEAMEILHLPEPDARRLILTRAMRINAENGHRGPFDAAREALGDLADPLTVIELENKLDLSDRRNQKATSDAAQEEIDVLWNGFLNADGTTTTEIRDAVNANENLDEGARRTELARINSYENQGEARLTEEYRRQLRQSETDRQAVTLANNISGGGTYASSATKHTYKRADGTFDDIPGTEIADRAWEMVNEQTEGMDPAAAMNHRQNWLSRSGDYVAKDLKSKINGGAASITSDMTEEQLRTGEHQDVVAGFLEYEAMMRRNPEMAKRHADGAARAYYNVALFLKDFRDGADSERALALASADFSGVKAYEMASQTINSHVLDQTVEELAPDALNSGVTRQFLQQYSKYLMVMGGVGMDVALEGAMRVYQDEFIMVNGMVMKAGFTAPDNIDPLEEAMRLYYSSDRGQDGFAKFNLEDDEIRLRPSADGARWDVVNLSGERVPDSFNLSWQEMNVASKYLFALNKREGRKEANETAAKWARRRNRLRPLADSTFEGAATAPATSFVEDVPGPLSAAELDLKNWYPELPEVEDISNPDLKKFVEYIMGEYTDEVAAIRAEEREASIEERFGVDFTPGQRF